MSPARFVFRLTGGVVLLNLFVFALAGLSVNQSYDQYQERTEITTQNLTQTLEREIAGAIKTDDLALLAVKDEYEKQSAAGNIARQTINKYIARVHSRVPNIDGLRIADERGRVVYGDDVSPDSQASLADRDHFTRQRDKPNAGLVISKPVKSRINDKWVIVFTRRLNHPDGSFAGIALASVTLGHLTQTFSGLNVGPLGVVMLLDRELRIVARHPDPQRTGSVIGQKVASPSLRAMVQTDRDSGAYQASSAVDGIERMFSYRRVDGYPLVVVVGLATEDYLAEWRSESTKQAALVAFFALITSLAGWLIYRTWKRQANSVEALANQETKFRTVADFTFDWEYWQGPDHEILYMTPSCERVTGYSQAEFVTDPSLLLRVIHPEDRHVMDQHQHDIAYQFADQDVEQVDFRIVRRDGEIRWISHNCRAITGQNGEHLGRRVGNRDITERKQAEDALLTTQHNLAEAQNLSHFGSWELDIVRNRLTWSEEMYRIFGMPPEEFGASYETFLDTLHPDDRDLVDRAYMSSLSEGGRYNVEYRFIRRSDGQLRWGHARCEQERDTNGKVLRSFGSVQDITERKRMEDIAERERIRLQTILRTSSDGIHILDKDGLLVEANEAFLNMLGYDDSAIGRRHLTDWALTPWTDSKTRLDGLIAQRDKRVFETCHRRRNGEVFDVEISVTAIKIEGKDYIYAASRDVTERKRAEVQLQELNETLESRVNEAVGKARALALRLLHVQDEERKHLARELHDETGQLLTAMSLSAHAILGQSENKDDAIHENADFIVECLAKTQSAVHEVIHSLRPSLLSMLGLADSLRDMAKNWQKQNPDVELELSLEDDPKHLNDLLNISIYRFVQEGLTNVAKYAEASHVSVRLRQQLGSDEMILTIADNGKGFDLVCRTEGFGLRGMQERATAAGGEVTIVSQPGKGVHIVARLPVNPNFEVPPLSLA